MKRCPQCQRTYADDMEFCSQDGTGLVAAVQGAETQLAAGLSRRFKIVRRLGAGGMGTVYLAEQIGVGNRPVALKVLNRKLLDDPEFILRFQNEAGSTGRIHHPNVVTIYEAAQADDGTPYIAMEYLDGETLRDELQEKGALSLEESADILKQTAHGLNAAHKLGIIHRDLKPDNIFLTRGEGGELQIKVVDFGIAKLREAVTHTMTGMVLGTPAYMSPEQAAGIRSDQLDLRSDEYSLGIVVYEMLSGSLPFHSDTPLGYLRKHMLEAPAPLRTIGSGLPVPPDIESVVMTALAKDRNERFESVIKFADEFSKAVTSAPAPETLRTTRVVEPGDWNKQNLESTAQKPDPVGPERPSTSAPAAGVHSSVQAAHPAPSKIAEPKPPNPEAHKTVPPVPPPLPAKVAVPEPRRIETFKLMPPPVPQREAMKDFSPSLPRIAPGPSGNGLTTFFKVGFWVLGISVVLLILENLFGMMRYSSSYGMESWLGTAIDILVGVAFVVIYCGILPRRRRTDLLVVALIFAAMGLIANNVMLFVVQERDYLHLNYAAISLVAMWRAFSISSGAPFSSVFGPLVMTRMGRMFYYATLANFDCLLKLGFLIFALLKYKNKAATSGT